MAKPEFSLPQAVKTLKEYGINTPFEFRRLSLLESRFGRLGFSIFEFEHQKNLKMRREFLEDIPYSFADVLCFLDGQFYTQLYRDDLFLVENMIDKRENKGLTYIGFKKFQKELSEAKEGEVVLWYSPKVEGLYDSGRLYFSFRRAGDMAINFDVKVLEEIFPILDFLNSLNPSQEKETNFFSYLVKPFRTGLSIEQFLYFLEKGDFKDETIYIQHRLPQDPQEKIPYNLEVISRGIREELEESKINEEIRQLREIGERLNNFSYQPVGDQTVNLLLDREQRMMGIVSGYWLQLQEAAEKTGGTLFLYGCSAFGVKDFGRKDPFNQTTMLTIFDSNYRFFPFNEATYSFDHEGICIHCHQGPKPLGPCNICEECDKKLQEENKYKEN